MTPQEAYKIGFQLTCAAAGHDAERLATQMLVRQQLKQAGIYGVGKDLLGTGQSLLATALKASLPLALATPPVAGALGGLALSEMQEPPMTKEEVQQDEMRQAYADAVRRMRKAIEERKKRQRQLA